MKIIVGLGNPGLKYRNTKHNIGFKALEKLARRHGIRLAKRGYMGLYGTGRIRGRETLLFKPLTFMNLSGEAVLALSSAKLKDIKDLLVINDDFSLPLGELRLRRSGSSGGHNGLESIIEKMGGDFNRLRIGIGSDRMGPDRSVYVLGSFSRPEKKRADETAEKAAECAEMWIDEGIDEAMRAYN